MIRMTRAAGHKIEGTMRWGLDGRAELLLIFYVIAWVVALFLTHWLAR